MAMRKIDFGTLTMKDYAIGVVYVVLATFIVTGAEMAFGFTLPSLVASAVGAAIGVAAWFVFLWKRNS
jgi:hypothetical protein